LSSHVHLLIDILLFSLIASLGTGLGGLIAIYRKPGERLFGLVMGITAGEMIYLSFLKMVNEAWGMAGPWTATIGKYQTSDFLAVVDWIEISTQDCQPLKMEKLSTSIIFVC